MITEFPYKIYPAQVRGQGLWWVCGPKQEGSDVYSKNDAQHLCHWLNERAAGYPPIKRFENVT